MEKFQREQAADLARAAVVSVLVILLVALIGNFAKGATPHPSDVRVWTVDKEISPSGTPYLGKGSGVVIYSGPEGSWVLTAAHNLRNIQKVEVVDISGKSWPAVAVDANEKLDLGIVSTSLQIAEPRPLAGEYNSKEPAWITGWPGAGREGFDADLANHSIDYLGETYGYWHRVIQGQSGGAILNKSAAVVGIVSAGGDGETVGTCGQAMVDYVKGVLANHKYEVQYRNCPNGRCQVVQPRVIVSQPRAVIAPVPQPRNQTNPQRSVLKPTCECTEKFAAVEKRLAALEARKPQPGPPGPQGPAGPQGPPGQDAQVDVAALAEAIASTLPPITVRYLREDGTPNDTETVHLGDTLDVEPIRVERIVDGATVAEGAVPVGGKFQIIDKAK